MKSCSHRSSRNRYSSKSFPVPIISRGLKTYMLLPYSWIWISVNDNLYFKVVIVYGVTRVLTILIYTDHYENCMIFFFYFAHICIADTKRKRLIFAAEVDLCVNKAIALCWQGKQQTLSVWKPFTNSKRCLASPISVFNIATKLFEHRLHALWDHVELSHMFCNHINHASRLSPCIKYLTGYNKRQNQKSISC